MTYARSRPPCSPTPAVRPVRRCGPSAPTAARSAKAQRGTATTHGECAVVSGGVAQHGGRLRRCTAVRAARRGATHLTHADVSQSLTTKWKGDLCACGHKACVSAGSGGRAQEAPRAVVRCEDGSGRTQAAAHPSELRTRGPCPCASPAVKAVHTEAYIKQLAATCVSLRDKADGAKSELEDDTIISASSLSAALCAVLSCCYAVDSCRVPAGEGARARVSGVAAGDEAARASPVPPIVQAVGTVSHRVQIVTQRADTDCTGCAVAHLPRNTAIRPPGRVATQVRVSRAVHAK